MIDLNTFNHEQNVGCGQTFFCAIDGSTAANLSLDLVMRDMMREKLDHLVIGHIYNSNKKYLPFNLRSNYLEDT